MGADVVVTGIGMLTPLGADAPSSAAAWRAGRRPALKEIEGLQGTRLDGCRAAALPAFDPAARLGGRRMLKYMSAAALWGCIAAREAVADARLKQRFAPERIGLFTATGLAAASVTDVLPMLQQSLGADGEFSCRLFGEKGLAAANPLLSFKILANMPPCLVSILEAIKGPNLIFNPWEGQGGAALLEAWRAVADGEVEAALTGAADNPAHPATFVHLRASGLIGEQELPAPAAAYLVLERGASARRDGQRVYAMVEEMNLQAAENTTTDDPLSGRLGRTYAAAPAVLLGLAGCTAAATIRI